MSVDCRLQGHHPALWRIQSVCGEVIVLAIQYLRSSEGSYDREIRAMLDSRCGCVEVQVEDGL